MFDRKLSLVVDMHGCPNRCLHCWLGHLANTSMSDGSDSFIVDYFKPYFDKIAYYSWMREPDFVSDYRKRWERDCELSVNCKPERFELASFWRICRDEDYVRFLSELGVRTIQLTFFGTAEMTDKYVGRHGAFEELMRATDILIENGIAPRYQAFINEENKDDIVRLLELIHERELFSRCEKIGMPFKFFVHEGSCDGENLKLYDIRIIKEHIPSELVPYYLDIDELLSESECCKILKNDSSHFVPHNEDDIVLNITADLDVYYNFTHITQNWKIGNLLTDDPVALVERIVNEDTFALTEARKVTLSSLADKYGNLSSERAFRLDDYKAYLLNCHIEGCEGKI